MARSKRAACAAALAAIASIALGCRSRPLDKGVGTGTITVDGGGGAGGGADGGADSTVGTPRPLPLGVACAAPADCSSGFCEDGVCCTVSCLGPCVSCAAPGTTGRCLPIPAGMPARPGGCPMQAVATCGDDGTCDGAGACRLWGAGTPCALGRCSVTTLFDQKACDGHGQCLALGELSCDEGYGCDPVTVTCRTTCATDGGCPSWDAGTDAGSPTRDGGLD
jgi:hypothetical protein